MRHLAIVLLLFCSSICRGQEPAKLDAPKPKIIETVKHEKAWLALSALAYGATVADVRQTVWDRDSCKRHPGCLAHETDPLERPIVHLPTPAYYAARLGEASIGNWLGWRMKRSSRWYRRIWWAPQTIAIVGGSAGAAISARGYHWKSR